ncbi:MAG: DUF1080 domain-containing protein [Phycisphaerae bacterium]|nr:DUF1080 domain-containing protein [Phycisphaerae bacterium]
MGTPAGPEKRYQSRPTMTPTKWSLSFSLLSIGLFVAGCVAPDANPPTRDLNHAYVSIFNGRDLAGWKGLVADPPARASMTASQLAAAQALADESMRRHWSVQNGELQFDGHGESLCTARDYANFELLVDWKIPPGGDSGIYLRGSPQVQIWDNPIGSGGLYNNQLSWSNPLIVADRSPGEWNTFRITIVGERVTVYLNDRLVVDDVVLENYWERGTPIYSSGQIELQAHGGPLWFRNVRIREIP